MAGPHRFTDAITHLHKLTSEGSMFWLTVGTVVLVNVTGLVLFYPYTTDIQHIISITGPMSQARTRMPKRQWPQMTLCRHELLHTTANRPSGP